MEVAPSRWYWRYVVCAVANVFLRPFDRRLQWIAYPSPYFAWEYPDTETVFVEGMLIGSDGKMRECKRPTNPRKIIRIWK